MTREFRLQDKQQQRATKIRQTEPTACKTALEISQCQLRSTTHTANTSHKNWRTNDNTEQTHRFGVPRNITRTYVTREQKADGNSTSKQRVGAGADADATLPATITEITGQ